MVYGDHTALEKSGVGHPTDQARTAAVVRVVPVTEGREPVIVLLACRAVELGRWSVAKVPCSEKVDGL